MTTEITELTLDWDANISKDVSRVLVVFDARTCIAEDVIAHVKSLGYHVVLLQIPSDVFKSVAEFIKTFETTIRQQSFVFALFVYSTILSTLCMYCGDYRTDSNPLLKHAAASAYIQWGRGRCAIVHPPRCCSLDSSQLPANQIEDMAIPWSYDMTEGSIGRIGLGEALDEIEKRLKARKQKDARTTKHVLTVEEVVPTEKEEPIGLTELLRLVEKQVSNHDAFVSSFGVNPIEWEELRHVSKEDALFFVLRREVAKNRTTGLHLIASQLGVIGQYELARFCRDFADESKTHLYRSDYTLETPTRMEESIDEFLGGRNQTAILGHQPNPEDDTHLDKLQSGLLPPYIRDALQLQKDGLQDEYDQLAAETIERAQALDREYEKRKLERELLEYQGKLPSGSTLLGGYNDREKKPGKNKQ